MAQTSETSATELPKAYDPQATEPRVRDAWDAANPFHPDPADGGPYYSIVIPPPNVTAALHLGHALNNTLQDVLIRYHRARGYNTLWMPGTDHAGIATQTVVDKRLQAEGQPSLKDYKRREAQGQPGREEFIAKVQAWKDEYEATIIGQLKHMGCSCDWDRTRFTMDEVCARAVREAFFRLFKDGLIYRGKRIVNWDPVTQTALADDEVEMEEVDGHFWYLRYPVVERREGTEARRHIGDGGAWVETGEYVVVATTRPETMLGDTAVGVNPRDPERARFIGRHVRLPIVNRIIPVIGDDYVVMPDPESDDPKARYASGFLKVTPAHDPNDYEIGQRHNLKAINVLAPDATISRDHGWAAEEPDLNADEFLDSLFGLDRYEAREAIVTWFRENNLLADVRPYTHSVGHSYRSHVPIEPYLSDQWYVGVTRQIPSLPDEGTIEGTNLPKNSLAGFALRALARGDRADAIATHETSPKRERGTSQPPSKASPKRERGINQPPSKASPKRERGINQPPSTPPLPETAYLITWTTHCTWLHGDERGSVDRDHNTPHTPYLDPDASRRRSARDLASRPPVTLDERARGIVRSTIEEVCAHRRWRLLAVNVRSNHVHTVVTAEATPEKVMIDLKAWATRRLVEAGIVERGQKVWTEHGSTRYVKGVPSVEAACRYVLEEQGRNATGTFGGERASADARFRLDDSEALRKETDLTDLTHAHASGSLSKSWEGALRFYPERYAKTFQAWHENIRDWCISRQLWWGHRIPVWSVPTTTSTEGNDPEGNDGCVDWVFDQIMSGRIAAVYRDPEQWRREFQRGDDLTDFYLCIRDEPTAEDLRVLKQAGFVRDPDVLDTWFSSGLWPLSTMGWPEPEAFPDRFPEGRALLDAFNPTNVLCTAREIITLWVSRMVMFNLYFTQDDPKGQRLPFHDVFIHAMIQDGEGRKMSKSLGNGVDPRDIIRTKGADAMRYTLAHMTTQTQDVRMPVEFDEVIGANTSPKFEIGRRLANKLWNATRFTVSTLSKPAPGEPGDPTRLIDRWILSRLGHVTLDIEAALRDYQFNVYAQSIYDLFWRDFCDWYLEGVKPTIADDPTQQAVLRAALGAIHRLFHPLMPFVTETLHESIESLPVKPIVGVDLPPSDLAATAAWPYVDWAYFDVDAEQAFESLRELIAAVREIRATHKVPDRRRITLHVVPEALSLIDEAREVVESLAGLERITTDPAPADAVRFVALGRELAISSLREAIDVDAERDRLTKAKAELQKRVAALEGRLSNPNYVERAPAHLVDETRRQLAEANDELENVIKSLNALG